MPADTLTIPLTGQLADDVRAAAEARGLSVEEWATLVLKRRMAAECEANEAREKQNNAD